MNYMVGCHLSAKGWGWFCKAGKGVVDGSRIIENQDKLESSREYTLGISKDTIVVMKFNIRYSLQ
jgi:hypothetical protein